MQIDRKRETARADLEKRHPEQEFRDTHCGKDPEEWERDEAWRNSEEGKKKTAWYYEQFDKLFGVKFSA